MGWGPGYFGEAENGTTWNLENPMRRDTVTVPAFSHIVIRFLADNPGLWALHVSLCFLFHRKQAERGNVTDALIPPVYSAT